MALLDGKVAIITGAGRGIGRATARLFAAEGARVIVNDLGSDRRGEGADPHPATAVAEEIRRDGGDAIAHPGDVADPATADALVDLAVRRFGKLDVLVNSAGVVRDKILTRQELSDFQAVLRVHVEGTFLCLQAAAKAMRGAGGSIVNTTSVAAFLGNYGQVNYAAANAAIHAMTRTASIELQRHDVRVNAVAPVAKTRMTEDLPMFEKVDSLTVDHVAPAHLYFASDLSAGQSGQVLAVAGGKLSTYAFRESEGRFKEGAGGRWTAQEIAEHWKSIAR